MSNYPSIAIQIPDGRLYPMCSPCNGSGKMYRYTSTSNYPGSKEGTRTKTKCGHCDGAGYAKNAPIKVIPLAEFDKNR